MTKKSEFIRHLQTDVKALSPFEISQQIRLKYFFVSTYQGDPELRVSDFRGYMVKYSEKLHRSAEDPELYTCIISLEQSKAWQDLIWIKEILQILDHPEHRTNERDKLGRMLDNRQTNSPNGRDTPLNVMADKVGLTLALGSAIPHAYREILREQRYLERYSPDDLEQILNIPAELIPIVLETTFEKTFEDALLSCS